MRKNYSLTDNGLVMVVEKRRSRRLAGVWLLHALADLPSCSPFSAGNRRGSAGQHPRSASAPFGLTFGRDPNDLTNARRRLLNDRPHMLRVMGSIDVPRTGIVFAANLQYFSGKPWAATALVPLPQTGGQPTQRVLLEPRGSHRLSAETLLDVRVSRTISVGGVGRIELLLDVLNALNDTAEEAWPRTISSARRSVSPPSSWIRVAQWPA